MVNPSFLTPRQARTQDYESHICQERRKMLGLFSLDIFQGRTDRSEKENDTCCWPVFSLLPHSIPLPPPTHTHTHSHTLTLILHLLKRKSKSIKENFVTKRLHSKTQKWSGAFVSCSGKQKAFIFWAVIEYPLVFNTVHLCMVALITDLIFQVIW